MRPELLHLSGPSRGRTIVCDGSRWRIGAGTDCAVRYDGTPGIAEHHAEIFFHQDACTFHIRALDGPIFVNQTETSEVILEADDLVEIGEDGPKFRFRVHYDKGAVCKPVRRMLDDARDVGKVSGIGGFTLSLWRDLFSHATWQLKVFFPISVILLVFMASWAGGAIARQGEDSRDAERRGLDVEARARDLRHLQAEIDEFKKGQSSGASSAEVESLRSEIQRHKTIVDKLAERDRALKTVLTESSKSVALIYGAYSIYETIDGVKKPLPDKDGAPLLVEYFGSGFMVRVDGTIVTNRHVAEPWWQDDMITAMIRRGFKPEFVRFDVCFPDRDPVAADVASIRLAPDEIDVATIRVPIAGVKPLALFAGDPRTVRGEHVVLVGYPTGIGAVLARADEAVATKVVTNVKSTKDLIDRLAAGRLITPVITQGALNEVQPKRLVYDAGTTHGGSGGPVFGPSGEVIGVNFAVTRDFAGSNFGIPISFARALLR